MVAATGVDGSERRVLVTDGGTRAALAIVRSLGRFGFEVHVAADHIHSLAGASAYAEQEHVVCDVGSSPRGWLDGVERIAERTRADWILPVTEASVGTMLAFGFRGAARVCAPAAESYRRAVDKWGILELGRHAGLAVPRSVLVEDQESLSAALRSLEFPVVLKSRYSQLLLEDRWRAGGARRVDDEKQARSALEAPMAVGGLLAQEWFPGRGEGIFLLASNGRVLAAASHRRVREKPPAGGVSVLRVSVEPDPQLLAGASGILERLEWTGVAMFEFRRAPTGPSFLMEINPRPWGSLQLAIDAGIDFPVLWLSMLQGRPVVCGDMKVGVRSRWLLGDLDRLWIGLRSRRAREEAGESAAQMLLDFTKSFVDGTRTEVLRLDDPLPFVAEVCTRMQGRGSG